MAKHTAGKLNNDTVLLDNGLQVDVVLKFFEDPPYGFAKTLDRLIDDSKLTNEKVAEAAGLSDKLIRNYRKDNEANPELSTVMALCIALRLEPELSEYLIEQAGYRWRAIKRDMEYRRLLWKYNDEDIYRWNERLEAAGVEEKIPNKKFFQRYRN